MDDPDFRAYPGEEHYYNREKLKEQQPFYRRHVWPILTCILAGLVIVLTFITVGLLSRQSQVPPPATPVATATQAPTITPTQPPTSTPTPTPPQSILASGQRYEGKVTQRGQSFGSTYAPEASYATMFTITNVNGNSFEGTLNLQTLGEIAVSGMIINDINNISNSLDQQRLNVAINLYGSSGTLIQYTTNRVVSGQNTSGYTIVLNCKYYALVGFDGTMRGIWFFPPDVNPNSDNQNPDGNFFFQKSS